MTEQTAPPLAAVDGDPDAAAPTPTGHPVVDEVLASLAGLDQRPLAEHVEVLTSAHDRLRGLLVDAEQTAAQPAAPASP